MNIKNMYSRRKVLKIMGWTGLGLMAHPILGLTNENMLQRKIYSSGEMLPVVGLGTWQTFDVGGSEAERKPLREVLTLMKEYGGKVIDSSPMYGRSEAVIGELTNEPGFKDYFFYATKVWTSGENSGIRQMNTSMNKMNRQTMDLMQVHNLVDWKTHLKTLYQWKENGEIRYIGITHYTASAHDRLEQIIKNEEIDFVQVNYSIRRRNAEKSLLGTAMDRGVAVLINRPYEGGSLFNITKGKEIPEWAKEYDINSWGQFFLKFILSNPAVTCVIPGTSKPHHLVDNMKAGYGKLPGPKGREKMKAYIQEIK